MAHHPPLASTSTASIKSDFSFTPTAHPKLTAAQSELLACEAHLATKERELWECRMRTVSEGLSARSTSMVECGRAWGELGNEALKLLENLSMGEEMHVTPHLNFDADPGITFNTSTPPGRYPPMMPRLSSDLTSLTSFRSITPNQEAEGNSSRQDMTPADTTGSSSRTNWRREPSHADTSANSSNITSKLQILPPHAISEFVFPISSELTPPPSLSATPTTFPEPTSMTMPSLPPRILPHRITEEDLHRTYSAEDGGSSFEEENPGPLQVIENPQFATHATSGSGRDNNDEGSKRFSIRNVIKSENPLPTGGGEADASASTPPRPSTKREKRDRKAPYSSIPATSRFFGSFRLRSLFRKDSGDASDGGLDDPSRLAVAGGRKKPWVSRTSRNVKRTKAGDAGGSSDEGTILRSPSLVSPVVSDGGGSGGRRLKKTKQKVGRRLPVSASGPADSVVSPAPAPQHLEKGAESEAEGDQRGDGRVRDGGVLKKRSQGVNKTTRNDDDDDDDKKGSLSMKKRKAGINHGQPVLTDVDRGSGGGAVRRSSIDVVGRDADMQRGRFEQMGPSRTERRAASVDDHSRMGAPMHSRLHSVSSKTRHSTTITKDSRRGGRPAVGQSAGGDAAVGPSDTSLMSVVEGIARQNREGWATYVHNREGGGGFTGGSPKDDDGSRVGNGLVLVKAPTSVSRDELDAMVMRKTTPSAPGTGHQASRSAPSLIQAFSQEGSTTGTASARLDPTPNRRPVTGTTTKVPLRSALRNASRTPSPLPTAAGESVRRVNPAGRDRDGGKRRTSLAVGGSDGEASESSYETGHEMFDEEEDKDAGSGNDRPLPPPPTPPDKTTLVSANGDLSVGNQDRNREPDSDPTRSTRVTEPLAVVGNGGDNASPPVRRKSVRVALPPTFSPTPPAIEEAGLTPPWDRGEKKKHINGVGEGWQSRVRRYPQDGADMWADSSDEDEEYQRARRLLMAKMR